MTLRETAPKLSPEQYEKNFAEISPRMTSRQAAIEAARCLFCFDAPCIAACPTHIDVPTFIKKISSDNLRGSARVILEANILGHSCGRVCPTEVLCEGACVMHEKQEKPIEIGQPAAFRRRLFLDRNMQLFHAGARNGKRVALIGAGPASLACAAELAKLGYHVTIFDRNEFPGGLDTYGIAAYKLRAKDSLREAELIRGLGVEFIRTPPSAATLSSSSWKKISTRFSSASAPPIRARSASPAKTCSAWSAQCNSSSRQKFVHSRNLPSAAASPALVG